MKVSDLRQLNIEIVQLIAKINFSTGRFPSGSAFDVQKEHEVSTLQQLKYQRFKLLNELYNYKKPTKIYISETLKNCIDKNLICEVLPKDFFSVRSELGKKIKMLEGAIVILNNNDSCGREGLMPLAEIYMMASDTIFCIWDFDNHHWLDLSLPLASISDLYFPAHSENLSLLTQFSSNAREVVTVGSIQWNRAYLESKSYVLFEAYRQESLSGRHIKYPPFIKRNKIVEMVSLHHKNVGFAEFNYHEKPPEERLSEWCSFKAHLTIPVLNDLPNRLFDALITGGIPIVPIELRPQIVNLKYDEKDIVFFEVDEIDCISSRYRQAIENFDLDGMDGILRRNKLALSEHHGACAVQQIIGFVGEKFKMDFIPSK